MIVTELYSVTQVLARLLQLHYDHNNKYYLLEIIFNLYIHLATKKTTGLYFMKTGLKSIAVLVCVLYITSTNSLFAVTLNDKWDKLHSLLDSTLVKLDEQRELPDSTWRPLKKDKKSVQKGIDSLIDEAISILNISDLSETKNRITTSLEHIKEYQATISQLQTEKMMAPKDIAGWKLWKKDEADFEEMIESYERKIIKKENDIEKLKIDFQEKIMEVGIDLDSDQVDMLIYSVTGDDDVKIISVFNNVKVITNKLKELSIKTNENIESARRYYGMHTVLLKVLLHLQDSYNYKVENEYLPKLDNISSDNKKLTKETKSLLKESEKQYRDLYKSNLEAQKLTDKTISFYKKHLIKNAKRMTESRKKSEKEYRIAENTYNTVSTAYSLITLMRNTDKFFNSVNDLQIPELLKFENNEMKEEFKKLTAEINSN